MKTKDIRRKLKKLKKQQNALLVEAFVCFQKARNVVQEEIDFIIQRVIEQEQKKKRAP